MEWKNHLQIDLGCAAACVQKAKTSHRMATPTRSSMN
jgi:hypothetical protein